MKAKKDKPCKKLNYCPYGVLVEESPLPQLGSNDTRACLQYGHICPVFVFASAAVDEDFEVDEGCDQ